MDKQDGLDPTKIYEDKITIGGTDLPISLHLQTSFTGRNDVALKINGKICSVGEVEFRRGGNIWYSSKSLGARIKIDSNETPDRDSTNPLLSGM